ncbi:MAG: DNA-binding protein [Campylobacterota bacterium]|nr:DNA-binding protein [Campylobacterota bacterium]
MKKFTVSDAATHFGISKEAIHNRIRRGSLETLVEDGIKMVVVPDSSKSAPKRVTRTTKAQGHDERYYKLLEEQNAKLQSRVEVLEGETRSLRDQKELMLIEERKKIESIYKEKDEQLKNILNTISSQFALTAPSELNKEEEALEVEIEEEIEEVAKSPISLKKYLKSTDFSEKKIQKIKARFKKRAKNDDRIIMIGNKLYIDPSLYNYSDLF